jgi:hypothetical protein
VTPAERSVRAASSASALCLSLRRAFVGPAALGRLRRGEAATLSLSELRVALGLAWAERDLALVRTTLDRIGGDRVVADVVLAAFHQATIDALSALPAPPGGAGSGAP